MLYLHLFSSFFHFRLYSTSRISDIAVPRFVVLKAAPRFSQSTQHIYNYQATVWKQTGYSNRPPKPCVQLLYIQPAAFFQLLTWDFGLMNSRGYVLTTYPFFYSALSLRTACGIPSGPTFTVICPFFRLLLLMAIARPFQVLRSFSR